MRAEPGKPLSDDDVARLISAEMTSGLEHVFGADNIAAERDRNYDYYRGVMNDLPAPPGRSRVVENTVANYIGLMKPSLLRIFTAGRNIAEYVSPQPDLQPAVRLVTRFINDVVFRKDNRGELLLGDWAEDALVQSVGSNVNLWGGYINTDLQIIEQAAKGYQSLAVSGDATVSWTNYVTGNTGAAARLKLTGSPAAPCTLTFPALHNFISVENATAQTVTIACSGGVGVAIAAGQKALLYCDGVDYHNAAPTLFPTAHVTFGGQLKNVTAATANGDAVNLLQMNNAIAAGLATVTTDGTFYLTFVYEAAGGETSISGADGTGNMLAYTPGFVDIYLNGALLSAGGADPDYVASNGTSITSLNALAAGDIVEIHAWNVFSVADTYTQGEVNALFAAPPATGLGNVTPRPVYASHLTVSVGGTITSASGDLSIDPAGTNLRVGGSGDVVTIFGTSGTYALNAYYESGWKFAATGAAGWMNMNNTTGSIDFQTGGAGSAGATLTNVPQFRILHTPGATNFITVAGRNAAEPTLSTNAGGLNVIANGTLNLASGNANIDIFTNTALTERQVAIVRVASANRYLIFSGSNGGNPRITTSAGQIEISNDNVILCSNNAARPVYWVFSNNASGGNTFAYPVSDVSSAGIDFATKGSGVIGFYTGTTSGVTGATQQFQIIHTASANRYVTITGSNGGNPTINVSGGNLSIASSVRIGAFSTDYVEAGGGSGTVGISAAGSTANIQFNLSSAGGGSIVLQTGGNVPQLYVGHTASANRAVTITGSNGGNPAIGTTNGDLNFSPAGTVQMTLTAGLIIRPSLAIPAGGSAGVGYLFSSTSNFGVFFGSGAPSLSAAKGSLYLRSDGTTTNDRAYVNTNGSTTWTALTTAA